MCEAARRKAENTLVAVTIGLCAFVVVVCVLTFIATAAYPPPLLELAVLFGSMALSQMWYRKALTGYYRTADLA